MGKAAIDKAYQEVLDVVTIYGGETDDPEGVARQWIKAGFKPAEVAEWYVVGVYVMALAATLRDLGYGPMDLLGISRQEIHEYITGARPLRELLNRLRKLRKAKQ